MNVGVAHSEVNPNTRVMNSRGIWLAYVILVGLLHVVLLSIPFFSIPVVWTLTNVIHNLVSTEPHPVPNPGLSQPKQNKATNCWESMSSFWDLSIILDPKDYFLLLNCPSPLPRQCMSSYIQSKGHPLRPLTKERLGF